MRYWAESSREHSTSCAKRYSGTPKLDAKRFCRRGITKTPPADVSAVSAKAAPATKFNAAFPVECLHRIERLTESTIRQWHFNNVRVVPLVHAAGDFALTVGQTSRHNFYYSIRLRL
jgi:hypothetical protein